MPAANKTSAHDVSNGRVPSWAALLRTAIEGWCAPNRSGTIGPGVPLVLLARTDISPLLDDLGRFVVESRRGGVIRLDAAQIAGDTPASCGRRVPIPSFSADSFIILSGAAGSGVRQQEALATVFDRATAAGATLCMALTGTAGHDSTDPRLASRLSQGLVIRIPSKTAAPSTEPGLSVSRIIRLLAEHNGMTVEELVGPGRSRAIVHARSLAMYLARRLTGRSLDAIGTSFGGRDHTTVMRGVRSVTSRVGVDHAFAGEIDRLIEMLSRRPSHRPRPPAAAG